MARDRQRAKQRKQRQPPQPSPEAGERDGLPEPDHLHRENVQGAWQHGGEVDEFEATLVAGADGEPESDPDAAERASQGDAGGGRDAGTPPPVATGGGLAPAASPGEPAKGRGGVRFLAFLRACWAELQRVQWPDRRQVGQATMVVLGFLIVAGAFLGLADFVAERVVDLII